MPPGRHSSSSHHSSSHSHHSSHSSHSSRSSYSSRSSSSSSSRSSYSSGNYATRKVPRPSRSRTNQPKNYNGKRATHNYNCRKHDYVYYGEDWLDTSSGIRYQKGYYDETGARYDSLVLEKNGSLESQFDCIYCGTSTKQVWKEGDIPHCSNCGANLIESLGASARDTIDTTMVNQTYYTPTTPGQKAKKVVIGLAVATTLVGIGFAAYESDPMFQDTIDQTEYNSNVDLFGTEIYVESIDRTIVWYDEYDSYYDEESDCYVYYNTDVEPAVWQYWYEDISSDYPTDCGWMEYELDEDQWYIMEDFDEWVKLPSKYDTDELWHMTGDIAGTSYSKDYNLEFFGKSITIDGDTASYLWDNDMISYDVKKYDCYVRVNFDVVDPTPQYWYEDISSDYCEDGYGGWMEYDYDVDCWYVVNHKGDWLKLQNESTENLWHIESTITGFTGTEIEVNKSSEDAANNPIDTYAPSALDVEHTFFLTCYFSPLDEDYIQFENANLVINVTEAEGEANAIANNYIVNHKSDVTGFFEKEKNDQSVTSIEELKNDYYTMSNRMDVTDWFDKTITVKDENDVTHDYSISKVELAIASYFYDEEEGKRDYYDVIADQYIVDGNYVFVQGIVFIFTFAD